MSDTCTSNDCDEKPAVIVYWPGQTPPPKYCIECALKAAGIAEAMGLAVHTEPLPLPEDVQ